MLASLAAVAMLTACEDVFEGGDLKPDGSKPSLTIENPKNNQALTKEAGLAIRATAVDKDLVKELQVRVTGEGAEKDFLNFTTFPKQRILEVDTLLTLPSLNPGSYKLTINVVDKRTNVSSKEVSFTVK